MLDAMEAWGAPPEEVAAVRARVEASEPRTLQPFPVHADNWETVQAFQVLGLRWTYAGMVGQRMGYDWAGVEAWIDRHIHRRRRRLISAALLGMERAVLQADAELRDKEKGR